MGVAAFRVTPPCRRFESDIPADDTLEEDEEPSPLDTVLLGMRQLFMKTVIKGLLWSAPLPKERWGGAWEELDGEGGGLSDFRRHVCILFQRAGKKSSSKNNSRAKYPPRIIRSNKTTFPIFY